jgi:hypothetical protein
MAKDERGWEHIVWTCLWCGFINAWNWEDSEFQGSGEISMYCDNCAGVTFMKAKQWDAAINDYPYGRSNAGHNA